MNRISALVLLTLVTISSSGAARAAPDVEDAAKATTRYLKGRAFVAKVDLRAMAKFDIRQDGTPFGRQAKRGFNARTDALGSNRIAFAKGTGGKAIYVQVKSQKKGIIRVRLYPRRGPTTKMVQFFIHHGRALEPEDFAPEKIAQALAGYIEIQGLEAGSIVDSLLAAAEPAPEAPQVSPAPSPGPEPAATATPPLPVKDRQVVARIVATVSKQPPGTVLPVEVDRGGRRLQVEVPLAPRPESEAASAVPEGSAYLGVRLGRFATIDEAFDAYPAAAAGLRAGDRIVRVGEDLVVSPDGAAVELLGVQVDPPRAAAGDPVRLVVHFEVTGDRVPLTLERQILLGDEPLLSAPMTTTDDWGAGRHEHAQTLTLPAVATPGVYTLRATLRVAGSELVEEALFQVLK